MEFLDKALEFLTSLGGASATITVVLEFAFRLFKTKKPLSVLHVIAKVAHKVADVIGKIADLLDKVLPQNAEEK